MIKDELLKRVIVEQQDFLSSTNTGELWEREYQTDILASMDNDHIIFLTGVRRSGKSYLLKIIKQITAKEKNLENRNFLYINFEDERLTDIEPHELGSIIENYYRLYQPDFDKKIILLFDEIQVIPQWGRWVNRLFEQKKYKIFITGSNASLLKEETGKLLTGRSLSIEIFPLSFKEYLYYFKKEPKAAEMDFYDLQRRAAIQNAFDSYVQNGGFPEHLKTGNRLILQEYFKDIIQRDVIYRYSIRYKRELKEIARFIISGPGNILSFKSIAAAVEMKNINTVKNYVQYLQESYLVFGTSVFSPSLKKQIYNPNKFYGIDAGLYGAVSFSITENLGPIVENIVFLELKRRMKGEDQLFYYKTKKGREIDFLSMTPGAIRLIQVSYDMSEKKTFERETRAIVEACRELGIRDGIIVNGNMKETVEIEGISIAILPIWEFLLTWGKPEA